MKDTDKEYVMSFPFYRFANHEKSKKHKELLAALKAEMAAEDDQLTVDAEADVPDAQPLSDDEDKPKQKYASLCQE